MWLSQALQGPLFQFSLTPRGPIWCPQPPCTNSDSPSSSSTCRSSSSTGGVEHLRSNIAAVGRTLWRPRRHLPGLLWADGWPRHPSFQQACGPCPAQKVGGGSESCGQEDTRVALHSRDHLSVGLPPWILHALGPRPLGPKRSDSPDTFPRCPRPWCTSAVSNLTDA